MHLNKTKLTTKARRVLRLVSP